MLENHLYSFPVFFVSDVGHDDFKSMVIQIGEVALKQFTMGVASVYDWKPRYGLCLWIVLVPPSLSSSFLSFNFCTNCLPSISSPDFLIDRFLRSWDFCSILLMLLRRIVFTWCWSVLFSPQGLFPYTEMDKTLDLNKLNLVVFGRWLFFQTCDGWLHVIQMRPRCILVSLLVSLEGVITSQRYVNNFYTFNEYLLFACNRLVCFPNSIKYLEK